MQRNFMKLDENFICAACGYNVKKLGYTSRDHCPRCLCSVHIDNLPGDRECKCKGLLNPIGIEKAKKNYKIIYNCQRCGVAKKNIIAKDDNEDLLIKLSSQPV
ncbi:MAG: RNHCP domain-containing protein [Firmicutes bacterium]|nr:RNHCP domain-containing protein [Bacillota bacterium]